MTYLRMQISGAEAARLRVGQHVGTCGGEATRLGTVVGIGYGLVDGIPTYWLTVAIHDVWGADDTRDVRLDYREGGAEPLNDPGWSLLSDNLAVATASTPDRPDGTAAHPPEGAPGSASQTEGAPTGTPADELPADRTICSYYATVNHSGHGVGGPATCVEFDTDDGTGHFTSHGPFTTADLTRLLARFPDGKRLRVSLVAMP